jgi:lipopolysaccharide/colanic/teichoic acid biosynthesis glycosyltransferase
MVHNAEGIGPPNVAGGDPRVTRVGRLLRQTKLDELPQLISVLLGDMTLVGPRPELQVYVDMYTDEEKGILDLKPGITDWASLVHYDQYVDFGKSNDPDKVYLDHIRPLKIRLQLYYLDHNSLQSDLKIIVYTVLKLLMRNKWIPSDVKPLVDQFRHTNAEQILPEDPFLTHQALRENKNSRCNHDG